MVRAIRKNLAEVIVNNRPVRPLILLNALPPSAASSLARRAMREFAERFAQGP